MNRYITIAGVVLLGTVVAAEREMTPTENTDALMGREHMLKKAEALELEYREARGRSRERSLRGYRSHSRTSVHSYDPLEEALWYRDHADSYLPKNGTIEVQMGRIPRDRRMSSIDSDDRARIIPQVIELRTII